MDPIIVATLVSPAIAVAITLGYEAYRRDREERLQLLRVLLVSRMHPADPAFVMAMNAIPLTFNKSAKVITAYNDCIGHLNSAEPTEDGRREKHQLESERKLSTLVFQMMISLGFKTTEADVQRAGYVSRGFSARDRLVIDSQIALVRIADATERNTQLLERIYPVTNNNEPLDN